MRTIHKYVLTEAENRVSIPGGARFLHVDNQHENITVWAEVNTNENECERIIYIVGTGQRVPDDARFHIGSVMMAGGDFIFHIYV